MTTHHPPPTKQIHKQPSQRTKKRLHWLWYWGAGWLGWEGIMTEDKGLIFPAGRFVCWAWEPMLRIAHQKGWIKKVYQVWKYDAFPVFRKYVNDVYALRIEAKENESIGKGSGSTALLYKYLLNSLYGKFGQRTYGQWKLLEKIDPEDWDCQVLGLDTRESCRWDDFPRGEIEQGLSEYWETDEGIWRYELPEDGMGVKSVASVAGYITAAARAKLLVAMQALLKDGHKVFMCDTDSVVTNGTLPEQLVGKALGQWELEETSPGNKCEFLAPKEAMQNPFPKVLGSALIRSELRCQPWGASREAARAAKVLATPGL